MHTLGIRLSWSTGGECGNCAHRLPFSADFPCKPRRVSRLEGWNAARCSFVTPGMPVQSAENELTCPRMLGKGRVWPSRSGQGGRGYLSSLDDLENVKQVFPGCWVPARERR